MRKSLSFHYRLVCCALLLLLSWSACAAPTSPLRFRRLGVPPNLSVLALMQDRQGYIWIGTQNGGVFRYDGYRAVQYATDKRNPASVPHNRIYALHEDGDGRIWVGTRAGLARFNPQTNDFTRMAPGGTRADRLDIKAIISDGKRGLWIATWGGVQHFDPASGKFEQFVHQKDDPGSLAHDDVNALALDARGGLWAATWPAGLDYLPPGAKKFQHFKVSSEASPNTRLDTVRALQFDRDQTLWIGTEAGVVTWRDGSDWSSRKPLASPPVRINQFHVDAERSVWAGTISEGLLRWTHGAAAPVQYVHRSNDPYSIPGDNIRAMLVDRTGMLWAGTFIDGIGLVNLATTGFERIIPYDVESANRRPNNMLPAIAGAEGGRLWLGGTGFSLFAPKTGEVVKMFRADPQRKGALSSDAVYSLFQQPGGPLWVGTSSGLNRLDDIDGEFKVIRFDEAGDNFINSISAGSGNSLWLGTGNSVIHYDIASGATVRHKHRSGEPDSRSVNGASSIVEDRLGRVWIGSEVSGGGLDLLDKQTGKVRHFRHAEADPASIGNDIVTTLFEDARGRLWVGTDAGLDEILTDAAGKVSFRHFTAPGSVGAVRILGIRASLDGNLWLSTPGGLFQLDPASGKASRYADADGISDAFTVGSAFAAADGTVYFGGSRGMTAVRPGAVRSTPVAAQVAITDVSVFNRSIKEGIGKAVSVTGPVSAPTAITLSAQEAVFAIEFSAMHYTTPSKNQYAYRLEGFDRDWIGVDASHRTATYTNLAPGQYRFRVKAANDRGQWSDREATLAVTILPPFWQTWWFRLLAGVLVVASLGTFYWLRVRRYVQNQAHLEALVAARTSEMEAVNGKLAALATTDGLTGLVNRRGFDTTLAREWARASRAGTPVALAIMDVDHFKRYNDHYGHQAGDRCLQDVAELLVRHGRRPGDVVARYGGEEFVLLMSGASGERALAVAEEICAELARMKLPHASADDGIVTISIGVAALVPDATTSPDTLIRYADEMLYHAKREGRNRALLRPAPALAARVLSPEPADA